MPALVWDEIRDFEAGLDHGVLYPPDGGGIPWNGLISVDEQFNSTIDPVYFDGIKFNDIISAGNFSATLRAYTYPDEFLEFEGTVEEQDGMYIADQLQGIFHMSYRTQAGEDGYKIHLLWNLTAVPSTKTYETLSLEVNPSEFEWSITSVPEPIDTFRPTSHVVLDSRKLDPLLLADIEMILYGDPEDPESEPRFPSLKGFISYVRKWDRLIITDHGDGTWTASANDPDIIEMLDETTFQITSDTAVFLDADSYEISSSEKNEEDI